MGAAFAVVALLPLRHGLPLRWWALTAAAILALMAMAAPHLLHPLNVIWTRFGLALNTITSPLLLAIVYFGAVVPTGGLMRAFGRDPMRRRRAPEATTYWIRRDAQPGPMTRQF
jgi:hypothetical protein